MSPWRRRALVIGGGALALVVLWLCARSFLPFMSDDSFISLRYADRFRSGRGLTWTDGERVEGYSNLLWILLVALVGLVASDLVLVARVLGVLGMAAACVAVLYEARARRLGGQLAALAVALALASSPPVAVWAIGGLEQPLLAALLAWAVALLFGLDWDDGAVARRLRVPALLLALVCLTRPDGPLFAGAIAAGFVLARGRLRSSVPLALRLLAPAVLAVAAQLAFRLAYYGDWVPNTAHVKVSLNATRIRDGFAYLTAGLRVLPLLPLALLGILGIWRDRRLLIALLPLVGWLGYVVVIGGDIFPTYRHLAPALVLAALVLGRLAGSFAAGRSAILGAALAAGLLPLGWFVARTDGAVARAREERWEWDGEVVGRVLRTAFAAKGPLFAVDAAGCLPYFAQLPALDMLGLNDRYLATHPPPGFGHGPLAHELGDGGYVLDRRPDLVIFCLPAGSATPCFRGGHQMLADPRFGRDYALVTLDAGPLVAKIYARKEGKIGITRAEGRVVVPGHLLTKNPATVVKPRADGALAAVVAPGQAARIGGLALGPGPWRVRAQASGAVTVRAVSNVSGFPLAEGAGELTLTLPEAEKVDVEVAAAGGPVLLERVELTRVAR